MGSHKNVIEINGKIYDAKSGVLIAQAQAHPTPRASGPTMDGVIRPARTAVTPPPAAAIATPAAKPKPHAPRANAQPLSHRNPQKSRTLMRHAVKKPAAPKEVDGPKVTPRASYTAHSNQRLDRAQSVEKSAYVNKFGTLSHHHPVAKRTEALPVRKAPIHAASPAPQHHTPAHPTPKHHAAPKSASEELFTRAIAAADHSTKPKKRAKHSSASRTQKQITRWGTGLAAAVLLVGFIAYMNLPNLNMQLASTRAGINADLPSYQPSGFKPGPISYKAGQVTIDFNSNTDDRSYTVTQAVSGWNSEALQENFLNARNKEFQTTQDSGRTIYMYEDGNATWVNGGIWYQVESNQALSSDQLLKIASSL